ncbi:SusC/RagA family TonB-linked outer membrane protein [Mucilaginibacter sp.]
MKKLLLVSLCFLMLSITQVFAQNRTVTGTVTAKEDGLPIPGVTVKVKGTTTGTQTTSNGKFSLSVPAGAVLQFTFIGYTAVERSADGGTINVSMAAASGNLGEVVVTGALGITRTRNQQSYAAQQISGDEVSKQRSSNFIDGLSGKVAGLAISQNNGLGSSTNVVIRGYKSILGNNQALFVIDGVPLGNENVNSGGSASGKSTANSNQASGAGGYDYGSPASDINPDDIESITVLKGAGATALYGSRGSNGVILITTKKAKRGETRIVVNSTISDNSVDKATLPTYQTQYGAGYGEYFNTGTVFGNANAQVAPTADDASDGFAFNPNEMIYQWNAFVPGMPQYGKATPWVAAANNPTTFFTNTLSADNSILVTSGGENSTITLGYTRNDDNGIIPNNSLTKNQVDFAGTFNITPKLTAGASINYYNTVGIGRSGTGYDGTNSDNRNVMTGFRQWWETNVDIKQLKQAYDMTQQNTTWNMYDPIDGNTSPAYWNNPYWVTEHNYETDSRNRYLGQINLNYKATSWLSFTGRTSVDTYSELQEERYDTGSIGVPYYSRYNHDYSETNFDLFGNVDKNISSDLNFKAVLGTNIRKDYNNSIDASTNGGLIVPGLYSLSNSLNAPLAPVEYDAKNEVDGVYAGATFTWRELITLDGTIRRDQSSTLPVANNTYYYPSVSGGFIFSNLLKNYSWLSYGKLRASYSQVGSDAPPYSYADTYIIGNPYGGASQTTSNATKNDPNLKPEQTKSAELGVELDFFHNRLHFDGTVYKTNTFDEILPVPVTSATGYNYLYENVGNVRNKGIELTLGGTPVQTTDFKWNVTVNFTAGYNEVTALYKDGAGNEATDLVIGSFQNGESINAPLYGADGTIRGTDYTYNKLGQKIVGADGEYVINSSQTNNIGNTNPDWTGGINNDFRYKGFDLSFLIDIRHGGSVYSNDMAYGLADGIYASTAGLNDLGNPVRNPVTNNSQSGGYINPGVYANGQPNTTRVAFNQVNYNDFGDDGALPQKAFVYDASYIKLREAKLSYDLPKSTLNKLGPVKGVQLAFIGRNLWIIHKNLPYSDPETGLSSGNIQGIQEGAFPTTRTLSFNLKLTF